MQVIDIPLNAIVAAPWNANEMTPEMRDHLRQSIKRFGLVAPLVVRRTGRDCYETVGGAQRLAVVQELGVGTVPCVLVDADDGEARLLSQALNRIAGTDNQGLRAELLRKVLEVLPDGDILAILPETANSLKALASIGQETIADYLQSWQQAQAARLKHLQFQLTPAQLEVVEEALAQVLPTARRDKGDSPNIRGTALYLLCSNFLKWRDV